MIDGGAINEIPDETNPQSFVPYMVHVLHPHDVQCLHPSSLMMGEPHTGHLYLDTGQVPHLFNRERIPEPVVLAGTSSSLRSD